MTSIDFSSGARIGLIVRGKTSVAHEPGNMEQHADCVLPNGAPVGFFGEGGAHTGASAKQGSWNSIGMNMHGVVYDYSLLKIHRPYYVDAALAKKYKVISTLLVVDTAATVASEFSAYWTKLKADPAGFYILGGNCSTRASGAFVYCKLLNGGIPGLDTPNNLFKQLRAVMQPKTKSYSGYIGFSPNATGGYDVVVDEV